MDIQIIDVSNPLWLNTLSQIRHDIYHLPEYVSLESIRTKTTPEAILIVDGEKIFFLPYLLRKCDRILPQESITPEIFDVVSPYGYPGILLSEAALNAPGFPDLAMDQLKRVLGDRGICSAFFRLHPILNHNFDKYFKPGTFRLNGETVSVDLKLSEAEIWNHTKSDRRNKINKCKKRFSLKAKMVNFSQAIDDFADIYEETMERTAALDTYYSFNREYFLKMDKEIGDKLYLCVVEAEEEIAAAAGLYTECCGIVQAAFGGMRSKFFKQSPSSLEIDYARYWAKERGNEFLHLGGGVGGVKDSVYAFKAGFSKQRHTFMTLRLITDEEKYRHLVELRAKSLNTEAEKLLESDFFPAYRSSDW